MALPQFSTEFTSSDLLAKVKSLRFSWFYRFDPAFPHPLLAALGLSVIFHSMMDNPHYQVWKSRTWSPAVKPILDFYEKKVQTDHSEFGDIQFWTDLGKVMLELTKTLLLEAKKEYKWDQILQEGKIDEEADHRVIEMLCKRFFLILFVLKSSNHEPTVLSFNEASDGQRFYLTILKEDGCLYYLGHEDFSQSKAIEMETQFPFIGQGTVDSRSVFTAETFSRSEPLIKPLPESEEEVNRVTEVMCKALELVRTLTVEVKFQPAGYSDLVQLCQRYGDYLRVHGKPILPCLALPDLLPKPDDPRTGVHQISKCSSYNISEDYEVLTCRHQFHVDCLKSHWITLYQQRASNPNLELTCPTCNYLADEVSVGKVHPELLEKIKSERNQRVQSSASSGKVNPNPRVSRPEYKTCTACRKQVSSMFVLRHNNSHEVCVTCLSSYTCPVCHQGVNESEKKIVEDSFYK